MAEKRIIGNVSLEVQNCGVLFLTQMKHFYIFEVQKLNVMEDKNEGKTLGRPGNGKTGEK
jgi:hypothetical protein